MADAFCIHCGKPLIGAKKFCTNSGELAGIPATGHKPIPPTGRKLSWLVNYVSRIESGKIVELWEAWDEANTYLKLTTLPRGK